MPILKVTLMTNLELSELSAKIDLFTDIPILKTDYLINQKYAVINEGLIFVSPAVWTLLDKADYAELVHIVKHLPLIEYSDSCLQNLHDQNR